MSFPSRWWQQHQLLPRVLPGQVRHVQLHRRHHTRAVSAGRRLLRHALPQIQRAEQLRPHVSLCAEVLENSESHTFVRNVLSATAASGGRNRQQHTMHSANGSPSASLPVLFWFWSHTLPICLYTLFCLSSCREQPQWRQDKWRTSRRCREGQQNGDSSGYDDKIFFPLPFSPCRFFGLVPVCTPWGMGVFVRGHIPKILHCVTSVCAWAHCSIYSSRSVC